MSLAFHNLLKGNPNAYDAKSLPISVSGPESSSEKIVVRRGQPLPAELAEKRAETRRQTDEFEAIRREELGKISVKGVVMPHESQQISNTAATRQETGDFAAVAEAQPVPPTDVVPQDQAERPL